PEEARQMPLALRNVLVLPPLPGLHDADPVALLRRTERGDTPPESGADDRYVVVEARHGSLLRSSSPARSDSCLDARLAPVQTLVCSRVGSRNTLAAARPAAGPARPNGSGSTAGVRSAA